MCIFLTFKYHSQLRIRTMSFAHVVDFCIIILHFYKSSNFVPSLMSKIYRNKILQRMRMSQIFISSSLLKKHLESSKFKIDIQTLCLSTFPRSLFTNNILKYLVQIVPLLACDILWKKHQTYVPLGHQTQCPPSFLLHTHLPPHPPHNHPRLQERRCCTGDKEKTR